MQCYQRYPRCLLYPFVNLQFTPFLSPVHKQPRQAASAMHGCTRTLKVSSEAFAISAGVTGPLAAAESCANALTSAGCAAAGVVNVQYPACTQVHHESAAQ